MHPRFSFSSPQARHVRGLMVVALVLSAAGLAIGQDAEMPVFKGKGSVNEPVNTDTGAIFDIGGATMTFPVGLPVGRSRLVTLKKGKRPTPKQVADGFSPIGPTMDFNGAFRTADKPIKVAVSSKKDPSKHGRRLVLAVEVGTLCDDKNKRYKLKTGLCSGWELVDADFRDGEVVAEVESTGGLRLQFGSVPND